MNRNTLLHCAASALSVAVGSAEATELVFESFDYPNLGAAAQSDPINGLNAGLMTARRRR